MKIQFYISVVIVLLLAGCKNEEGSGTVEIAFSAFYGNSPLILLTDYDYADGQKIRFSHLDFYISDLALLRDNGDVVELSEIDLIELDFSTAQQAVAGEKRLFADIPAGKYNGIRWGVGVKPSLNLTKPADYNSSHPLSHVSHYWEGWQSYIFSKTEGSLDQDGNGTYDLGFAIHSGSNLDAQTELYRELEANVSFDVTDASSRSIQLMLDYRQLLGVAGGGVDIASTPHTNDPLEMDLIIEMADNYADAFLISIP